MKLHEITEPSVLWHTTSNCSEAANQPYFHVWTHGGIYVHADTNNRTYMSIQWRQTTELTQLQYMLGTMARLGCCRDNRERATLPEVTGTSSYLDSEDTTELQHGLWINSEPDMVSIHSLVTLLFRLQLSDLVITSSLSHTTCSVVTCILFIADKGPWTNMSKY